ncbi:MAG: hypothetical protein RBT39_10210 [Azoarcus sp.]|nr:hypothetical protein [Azoarcus sp.]MDD2873401.1 hypothetical protein [Azoarcus sp.]MDX9837922.1 hypothetical protein [Azoarcus sp.]
MNARCVISMLAVAVLGGGLSGCGEPSQVVTYEQGKYQGKPDNQPWDNPVFKGDKTAWELAMKNRSRAQNEYNRTQ